MYSGYVYIAVRARVRLLRVLVYGFQETRVCTYFNVIDCNVSDSRYVAAAVQNRSARHTNVLNNNNTDNNDYKTSYTVLNLRLLPQMTTVESTQTRTCHVNLHKSCSLILTRYERKAIIFSCTQV